MMKHLATFIVTLCCICMTAGAQTYYYEKIAVVENNVKRQASGDGHFITFTQNACYDSDKDGYSEGLGKLHYEGMSQSNLHCYHGHSYFGEAYYFFASDRSRLNIQKSDGEILVYVRKNAPAGVTRSSRPKPNTVPPPIPVIIDPNPFEDKDDDHHDDDTQAEEESRYGYYDCPTCYGTGKCQRCGGDGVWRNSLEGLKDYMCTSCPNSSGRCPVCDGTGRKYGIIR